MGVTTKRRAGCRGLPDALPMELEMSNGSRPLYKAALIRAASILSKAYAVGPREVTDGVAACRKLIQHGLFTSLGKFSTAGDDPVTTAREYCVASEALKSADGADFYLSVKPPALGFRSALVAEVAATALANRHGVHFDSHGHDLADATLDLFDSLLREGLPARNSQGQWQLSLTLPSRWKRSLFDAQWAIERGVRVRLVKGEFAASSTADEMDPREGLLQLVDLLAGSPSDVAIGTHDYALAREAIARALKAAASPQLELLYGFPVVSMVQLARELGVPFGIYVPYGETLTVYAIRHLITHPKKLFRGSPRETFSSPRYKLARILGTATPLPGKV